MPRAYVGKFDHSSLVQRLREALEFLRWTELIPSGARVFLKPNLTWRLPSPGVTVTPEFLAAVVEVLRDRTPHITICESNGGYHSFEAEEAFESHGLPDLVKRFGIQVMNLS